MRKVIRKGAPVVYHKISKETIISFFHDGIVRRIYEIICTDKSFPELKKHINIIDKRVLDILQEEIEDNIYHDISIRFLNKLDNLSHIYINSAFNMSNSIEQVLGNLEIAITLLAKFVLTILNDPLNPNISHVFVKFTTVTLGVKQRKNQTTKFTPEEKTFIENLDKNMI